MSEIILLGGAIGCAIAYWLTIALLVIKNRRNSAAWAVAGAALVMWPALLFMSFMQLLVVIPLVAIFVTHGYDISQPLSAKTVGVAVGSTILFLTIVGVAAIIHDS